MNMFLYVLNDYLSPPTFIYDVDIKHESYFELVCFYIFNNLYIFSPSCTAIYRKLNQLFLASHKKDIGKQCRPTSDAAVCIKYRNFLKKSMVMIKTNKITPVLEKQNKKKKKKKKLSNELR